jgi:lipopolysaccharide/colanic/teichoic acid biosynthesis glycosyltransferase
MESFDIALSVPSTSPPPRTAPDFLRRGFDRVSGDLLPLSDFLCLGLATWISARLGAHWSAWQAMAPNALPEASRSAWVAVALAPFILYDGRFAAFAMLGHTRTLLRSYAVRMAALLGIVLVLGELSRPLGTAPRGWLVLWFSMGLLFTLLARLWLARRVLGGKPLRAPAPGVGPFDAYDFVGKAVAVRLLADRPIKRWSAVAKATEDLVLGGLLTLLLSPLLAVIAVAIRLDSPGPILFTQRRHALDNREFDIYKFRTMRWQAQSISSAEEPLLQTRRQDARVTSVGRLLRAWSLDELPQLFNVLRGEMSLVGPRPHAVNMRTEDQLGHEITELYPHRHRIRPGITGWSQVNGARGATDTVAQLRRRVEFDLHYIDNWSLLLDLKILALTAREVLRRTNAY